MINDDGVLPSLIFPANRLSAHPLETRDTDFGIRLFLRGLSSSATYPKVRTMRCSHNKVQRKRYNYYTKRLGGDFSGPGRASNKRLCFSEFVSKGKEDSSISLVCPRKMSLRLKLETLSPTCKHGLIGVSEGTVQQL